MKLLVVEDPFQAVSKSKRSKLESSSAVTKPTLTTTV